MIAGRAGSKSRPPVPAKTSFPSTTSRIASSLLRGAQRPREIVDNVADRIQAHGNADQLLANASGGERRCIHLLMCGARRMNHQRFGVADIGEMAREPHGLDKL